MKKCFAALLALCLLCGVSALAATNATVMTGTEGNATSRLTYTIPRRMNYTVTIPASLNLNVKPGERFSSTLEIALKDTDFSARGSRVQVNLTGAGFALKKGTYSIPYTISCNDETLALNDCVLEWIYELDGAQEAFSELTISGTAPQVLADGKYSDVITFSMKAIHPDDLKNQ